MPLAGQCSNSLLDLGLIAYRRRGYLHLEGSGRGIDHAQECLVNTVVRIEQHEQQIDKWRRLFQHRDPFSGDGSFEISEARDVSARLDIIAYKAATDRISHL